MSERSDQTWLAERFEANRTHLGAVAYRMLGSRAEADDAVQEAWVRLSRADTTDVTNLGGWLTTVVARICLDMLRSRTSRREDPLGDAEPPAGDRPDDEAVLADSVGMALLVVLDTLAPAERVAFVLHDLFAVPFAEIATIIGRTPEATRQLASRARRRVRAPGAPVDADPARRRAAVDAFLAAARDGDLVRLVGLLDPDVVVRADGPAVAMGAAAELRGAGAVAENFSGRARAAQPAVVAGLPGLAWAAGGRTRVAIAFTFDGDVISRIDLVADPETLLELDVVLLGSGS